LERFGFGRRILGNKKRRQAVALAAFLIWLR
jgi:hypothetical protein